MMNGTAARPNRSHLTIATVSLGIFFFFTTLPYIIYPKTFGGSICSTNFCYDNYNNNNDDGDDDSSKSSSSSYELASCAVPDDWSDLTCLRGVSNKCDGNDYVGLQSPIDFTMNGGGGGGDDDDGANDDGYSAVVDECLGGNNDDDGDDGANYERFAYFDAGDCSFSDLSSTLNLHQAVTTNLPKSCKRPTVTIPQTFLENNNDDDNERTTTFQLIQYHVHIGSEHTFNGERYDAELHLFHQSKRGETMVIAVPIKASDDYYGSNLDISSSIQPLINTYDAIANNVAATCNFKAQGLSFPRKFNPTIYSHTNIDVSNVLPENWSIYDILPNALSSNNAGDGGGDDDDGNEQVNVGILAYVGSLTTPPCSTNVKWIVLDTPLYISVEQWQTLSYVIGGWKSPFWPSCVSNTMNLFGEDEMEDGDNGDGEKNQELKAGTYRPTQSAGDRDVLHYCSF